MTANEEGFVAEATEQRGAASTYARPIPLIGDRTTALERRADPAGWALNDDEIEVLDRTIRARRDIRRFRPDDVAPELVREVLVAAHNAPSVGLSQPWRFVIVRDLATRQAAAAMADRNRLRQAAMLDPESARQLLALQLEGLREAPVGIVVGCDRRAPAAGVLGRATMPDADLWSCACAIQNLWLAARARGLGVGWVTLFEPAELAALVGFPEGVVPLGWLCLGYPDERPPAPGLERRGWSSRLGLDEVVMHERWPEQREVLPPVSRLAERPPTEGTDRPDTSGVADRRKLTVTSRTPTEVRDRRDDHLAPPDGLGLLDQQLDRVERFVSADDPRAAGGGALVVAIGDHPVADLGVTAYSRSVTAELLRASLAGESIGARIAQVCGLRFECVDAGVASGDLVTTDALTEAAASQLVDRGRELGRELAVHGLVGVGEAGVGNTTIAAALAVAIGGLAVEEAVGLGAGSDSSIVATKRWVVEQATARVGRRDAMGLLCGLGGPEIAVLVGVILGVVDSAAVAVLDGMVTTAAALVAVELHPGAVEHLVAGQRSNERGHARLLRDLGLESLLDWRLRSGEGVGAAVATRLLLDGLRLRQLAPRTARCADGSAEPRPGTGHWTVGDNAPDEPQPRSS
ncbi:MAG: 5,6-dimethylbenzimidazole synthase [Acidimicrobiales bacterium]|nr:5,6-dimethylbenzimidazole synthase [Acidimicrobiales bacterium]